jgi:hypothetical protein
MDKPKIQKLNVDDLDEVAFWANWRAFGQAMGITPVSVKSDNEFRQYMNNAIANFEAESLFIAFEKADVVGWTRYVKDHPPSPETLAVLMFLGLEKHQEGLRIKGGKAKGETNRQLIKDAVANQGTKSPKVVKIELSEKGIPQRTIDRYTAKKLTKKPKA